jgi:hypothetical protein
LLLDATDLDDGGNEQNDKVAKGPGKEPAVNFIRKDSICRRIVTVPTIESSGVRLQENPPLHVVDLLSS